MKQDVDLRPDKDLGLTGTFGDAHARAQAAERLKNGEDYLIRPTLLEARAAHAFAEQKLAHAERKYGPIVDAINAPDPAPGDVGRIAVWKVSPDGMCRSLKPGAVIAQTRLRNARDAREDTARVLEEVESKTKAALAKQTVPYAVAPGRKLHVSSCHWLRQGEEVDPSRFRKEDFERLAREGHILERTGQ